MGHLETVPGHRLDRRPCGLGTTTEPHAASRATHAVFGYGSDADLMESQAFDLGLVQELFKPGDHQFLEPVRSHVDLHQAGRRTATARCGKAREHASRGAGKTTREGWRADLDASVRRVLEKPHSNRRSA